MDTWRQWIRHRTASVNEYSTRYSEAIDAVQRTAPDAWRLQSTSNRQGSGTRVDADQGQRLTEAEAALQEHARRVYETRIAAGVAREQARKDLPLATFTEAYWKIDLHNLLHFLELRMDHHAQLEIRAYATVIGEEIVGRWVPVVWEAFKEYRREGVRLSRLEAAIVRALGAGDTARATALAAEQGLLGAATNGTLRTNFERREIEETLAVFGFAAPWLG